MVTRIFLEHKNGTLLLSVPFLFTFVRNIL